jgi:ABC-type histidine transport system ATPase subunit
MIESEKIRKSYGRKPVLRGVSFQAAAGEVTLMVAQMAPAKARRSKYWPA